MALDVYWISDIRGAIVAGIVLAIEVAQSQGLCNRAFVRGVVALARHQANTFGIPWTMIRYEVEASLGIEYAEALEEVNGGDGARAARREAEGGHLQQERMPRLL